MKTKIIIFSSILFSLVFLSCQNDEIISKSPVVSVSILSTTNSKVWFSTKASWHNGCGSFSHFTSTKTDTIFNITVFGKEPKDAICTAAFIEFDAPVDIPVEESGRFTFRFWQSDSTTVDTTITF